MFEPKKTTADEILEREMEELAEAMRVEEVTSEAKEAFTERWLKLDERRMEHEALSASKKPKPDTLVNASKIILIAVLTLVFESRDIITSKVSRIWLRNDRD